VNKAKAAAFNERHANARRRLFDELEEQTARLTFELEAREVAAREARARAVSKTAGKAAEVVRRARAVSQRQRYANALAKIALTDRERAEDSLACGFGFGTPARPPSHVLQQRRRHDADDDTGSPPPPLLRSPPEENVRELLASMAPHSTRIRPLTLDDHLDAKCDSAVCALAQPRGDRLLAGEPQFGGAPLSGGAASTTRAECGPSPPPFVAKLSAKKERMISSSLKFFDHDGRGGGARQRAPLRSAWVESEEEEEGALDYARDLSRWRTDAAGWRVEAAASRGRSIERATREAPSPSPLRSPSPSTVRSFSTESGEEAPRRLARESSLPPPTVDTEDSESDSASDDSDGDNSDGGRGRVGGRGLGAPRYEETSDEGLSEEEDDGFRLLYDGPPIIHDETAAAVALGGLGVHVVGHRGLGHLGLGHLCLGHHSYWNVFGIPFEADAAEGHAPEEADAACVRPLDDTDSDDEACGEATRTLRGYVPLSDDDDDAKSAGRARPLAARWHATIASERDDEAAVRRGFRAWQHAAALDALARAARLRHAHAQRAKLFALAPRAPQPPRLAPLARSPSIDRLLDCLLGDEEALLMARPRPHAPAHSVEALLLAALDSAEANMLTALAGLREAEADAQAMLTKAEALAEACTQHAGAPIEPTPAAVSWSLAFEGGGKLAVLRASLPAALCCVPRALLERLARRPAARRRGDARLAAAARLAVARHERVAFARQARLRALLAAGRRRARVAVVAERTQRAAAIALALRSVCLALRRARASRVAIRVASALLERTHDEQRRVANVRALTAMKQQGAAARRARARTERALTAEERATRQLRGRITVYVDLLIRAELRAAALAHKHSSATARLHASQACVIARASRGSRALAIAAVASARAAEGAAAHEEVVVGAGALDEDGADGWELV
jgi:hypothetical protein